MLRIQNWRSRTGVARRGGANALQPLLTRYLPDVPRANVADQRKRLEKERGSLRKNIANSTRQWATRVPEPRAAQVVESIRGQMAETKRNCKSPAGAQRLSS